MTPIPVTTTLRLFIVIRVLLEKVRLEFIELFGGEATLGPLPEGAGKNL